MPDTKQSLSLWSITDGHAGNERQALALASALGHGNPQSLRLQPRAPWRWLAPRLLPAAIQGYGSGLEQLTWLPPWLAIGCGRQAAGALRLLRQRGTRTVQILDPRIASTHWDLVIVPEHDRLRGENVLTLSGSLNPVNDHWLNLSRTAFPQFAHLPSPRVAVLIGGPTRHAPWKQHELITQLQPLITHIRDLGGSVLATTSRRTPKTVNPVLRTLLADTPGEFWSHDSDSPNPYAGLLGWADRIVCTADSVNLLSEACATYAPVGVLLGQRARGRLAQFQQDLRQRGRLLDAETALTQTPSSAIEPLRETARIANEVAKRMNFNRMLAERFATRSRATHLLST